MNTNYYVYEHATIDGNVFYVGKGSGRRAWWKSKRNKDWFLAASSGYNVIILCDQLSEIEAFEAEERQIKRRLNEGCILTNKNSGGRGGRGGKSGRTKEVYSSLGEKFDSVSMAFIQMKALGESGGSAGLISRCARGHGATAYSRAWSYKNFPPHPDTFGLERSTKMASLSKGIRVISSLGEKFDNISQATKYLVSIGYKMADSSAIARCIKGKRSYAYDRAWSRDL